MSSERFYTSLALLLLLCAIAGPSLGQAGEEELAFCSPFHCPQPTRGESPADVLPASITNLASLDETPIYTYRVLNVYPHDPAAFTQGLVYTNSVLFEGTGLWGESSLRRVDLESGEVLQIYNLPDQYFGEGIVVYGDQIVQLTWRSNIGFVYDRDSFELLDTFSYLTEGWGITHDGQQLIMSDGSSTLYFWDPETFAETGRVQVHDNGDPVIRLNELEYIEGEVYANVWLTDRIARIDPQTGAVVGWIDLRGLLEQDQGADVLNGIAYDTENERLFVTGKRWPQLFEIELVPIGLGPNTGWLQVNRDGFGDLDNIVVSALEPFDSFLYAGTLNEARGAQIWRSADGWSWQNVITAGFGYSDTIVIDDLIEFSGTLYASTYADIPMGIAGGGELWQTTDGLSWTRVISGGFGDPNNERIMPIVQYSDTLYAGTQNPISGGQMWRSVDGAVWEIVNTPGFGNVYNTAIGALATFEDWLYAGAWNQETGAEIWRTDGFTWTVAITGGFTMVTGSTALTDNVGISSLAVFQQQLYALTYNTAGGAELWRSADGTSWDNVFCCGLGNPRNEGGGALILFEEQLYFVSDNQDYGAEVWRTAEGTTWEQVGFLGWGDDRNVGPGADRAVTVFDGRLFVGTDKSPWTSPYGGEVWMYPYYEFALPVIAKDTP